MQCSEVSGLQDETAVSLVQEVEQMVCLVPELCFLTGLTDEMKNDFRVMKSIAMYTRITPNQRQAALKKFISNIQGMRACPVAEGTAQNDASGWYSQNGFVNRPR
jgi:hypothetical protein